MGILASIATHMKEHDCQLLIKRTQNEISISGAHFGLADLKVDIASFSNKLIELVKATQVAIALDDSQYLLCKSLGSIRDNDQLKHDCQRLRLMLIMAFSELRVILSSLGEEPSTDLKQQLLKWIEYMNELQRQSIAFLEPGPKMISKGPAALIIPKIMKYQGIDEEQLKKAISLM